MAVRVCVFDVYGTLIDAGPRLRRVVPAGCDGEKLVALWRLKQLEYSWTQTIMGRHIDFETLTEHALDWTLATSGLDDPQLRSALLDAYACLDAQPDAGPCLRGLHSLGIPCVALSNGSPRMLEHVLSSIGLAPLLDEILSVERVGVFKPDPRVYRFAVAHLGVDPAELAFQSANA